MANKQILVPMPDDYGGDDPAALAAQIDEITCGVKGEHGQSPLDRVGIRFYRGEVNAIIAALRASAPKAL